MATRHRRNAGTFYDVINTSNGYVISRSHYDKADAVKSMRRIAAEDKRSPTYKNRKLKVVARPIPKDHVPTRSWKKKGKKWEYNPKTGTTVPAHVRINPRTGRIQVFVTPKVAEKLRGGKRLRVAGNPGSEVFNQGFTYGKRGNWTALGGWADLALKTGDTTAKSRKEFMSGYRAGKKADLQKRRRR